MEWFLFGFIVMLLLGYNLKRFYKLKSERGHIFQDEFNASLISEEYIRVMNERVNARKSQTQ